MVSKEVSAPRVHDIIGRWVADNGLGIVCDLDKSHGAYIHDARSGVDFLDFSGCHAARPLAFDHPGLVDPTFTERLGVAARHKISSRQFYSVEYARFVERFAAVACESAFASFAFAEAEPAAVGMAVRAARSWKSRKNAERGVDIGARRLICLTSPAHHQIGCQPTFAQSGGLDEGSCVDSTDLWLQVNAPVMDFPFDDSARGAVEQAEARTLAQIVAMLDENPDGVAGILVEPIQSEAGDLHFRGEFLASLRRLGDEREVLLIFDEVRTGFGATGRWWDWQNHDVQPDLMIFGGRTGVDGVAATGRLDEVELGHFNRICADCGVFGADVVDMIRSTRVIELIASEGLLDNARVMGAYLVRLLEELAESHEMVGAVRGRGLCVAFDVESQPERDALVRCAFEEDLLVLAGGQRTVCLRPSLDIDADAVARGIAQLEAALRRSKQVYRR